MLLTFTLIIFICNASASRAAYLYTSNKFLHFVICFFVDFHFTADVSPVRRTAARKRSGRSAHAMRSPSAPAYCKFSRSDLLSFISFHCSGRPGAIIGKTFSVSEVG